MTAPPLSAAAEEPRQMPNLLHGVWPGGAAVPAGDEGGEVCFASVAEEEAGAAMGQALLSPTHHQRAAGSA